MAAIEFEKNLIECIQKGNVEEFKKMGLISQDVNQYLNLTGSIKIICKSTSNPFKMIRGPTPVILAVLCEQPEILKYMIENLTPNLSLKVNGWTAFHFAACTESYKCMEILLSTQYIQENIDMPVDINTKTKIESTTSALHIAVTNLRHAQALMLTQQLPNVIYNAEFKKLSTPIDSEYQSADVNILSATGNSPLHIAAKMDDWDMCQILLYSGADINATNSNGKTPAEIANPATDIIERLESQILDDISTISSKYIIEEPVGEQETPGTTEQKEEVKNEEPVKNDQKVPTATEVRDLTHTVQMLTALVQQLSARVTTLEAGTKDAVHACMRCGALTENRCNTCGNYYCDKCFGKDAHPCSFQ